MTSQMLQVEQVLNDEAQQSTGVGSLQKKASLARTPYVHHINAHRCTCVSKQGATAELCLVHGAALQLLALQSEVDAAATKLQATQSRVEQNLQRVSELKAEAVRNFLTSLSLSASSMSLSLSVLHLL